MLEKQQRSFPNFISYTVPNPNPLLSYSLLIPTSSKYPPEPDPFPPPNPYPHHYNGLQDLPALELDPSAVSRSEIITPTADLTPHEHAGGTLGETPMVSKSLNSSGNFGVVTQDVVNDVIATAMESEYTQCTEFEVCNITCNSKDHSLKKHRDGKEHFENLQKLAISSAIKPKRSPLNANATLDVEMENKKNNLAPVDSMIFCDICNEVCNNQEIFKKHLESKKHATQAAITHSAVNGLSNPIVSDPQIQPSNNCTQKQATEKPNIIQSAQCQLCDVICTSYESLNRHILGKKHLKNLKKSEKVPGPSSTTLEIPKSTEGENVNSRRGNSLWCELCGIYCDTFNVLNIHISGKKHQTNMENSQNPIGPNLPPTSEPAMKEPLQNSPTDEGRVVNSKNGQSLWSGFCGIGGDTYDVLNIHISGTNHQNNTAKSHTLGPNLAPINEPVMFKPMQNSTTDEGKVVNSKEGQPLWCELCGICCDTCDVLKIHISGAKHQKNMKRSQSPIAPNLPPTTEPATTPQVIGPLQNSATHEGKIVNSENGQSLWCELCGIGCHTYDVLKIHMSGKKHQKNMEKSEKPIRPNLPPTTEPTTVIGQLQNSAVAEGKVVNSERCKRKAKMSMASHENLETKRQNIMKEGAAYDALRMCTLCNMVCNSPTVFGFHLAGQKHAAMAAKAGSDGQKT